MITKFTNSLQDFFLERQNAVIFKLWGGQQPISLGEGIRFRVTKSPCADYVTVRYLSGYELFEIEIGALVGTEYDLLDRISPVSKDKLMATISKRILYG